MPTFDAHIDIFSHVLHRYRRGEQDVFRRYHLDQFRRGDIAAAIFAIYVRHSNNLDTMKNDAVDQLKYAAMELEHSKDIIRVVQTFDDVAEARRTGKIAAVIGLEGLSYLGDDPDFLYLLHRFGARSAMLSWNKDNAFGGGIKSGSGKPLTQKGRRAIRIMDELKILIDVSHSNFLTIFDILDMVSRPVIASHNNALSVSPSNKNLSDDVLKAIGQNGGVVGFNYIKAHVSQEPERQNLDGAVDQIEYMVNLMGIDHVGFGFDFMDFDARLELSEERTAERMTKYNLPGLMNSGDVPNLVSELAERGFSKEEIEKIQYRNFMRVLEANMPR